MNARPIACMSATMLALALAAPVLAGFAGTDVFLPMAGRQAGVHPSNWYTTLWIHNPGSEAVTARVFFLARNTVNTAPPWVDIMIEPGDTEKLENIVETYFHLETFGALRVTCDSQRLVVTSRVFSQAVGEGARDSVGQDFAGVPASFAIGIGEKSQVLGVHQTLPAANSKFRFNFGLVETTGHSATVRVRAFDENGDDKGFSDINVRELSQRQVAFKDHFPTVSTENARLELGVISGSGKVIAYGSGIANGSQDPTTFEMAYNDSLLGAGTITGVTAGEGLTGGGVTGTVALAVGAGDGITVAADTVAIADGGVTTPKLAAAAVTPDRVAPSATVGQVLTTVAAGSAAPGDTMALAGNAVAWTTPVAGDITEVVAGTGLNGGGIEGAVTVNVEVPLALSGNDGSSTPGDWRGIVKGVNSSSQGSGIVGVGLDHGEGVLGFSAHGVGVWGQSDDGVGLGVYGAASGGPGAVGVRGASTAGTGVSGLSSSGVGVEGRSMTGQAVRAFLGEGYGWGSGPAAVFARAAIGPAVDALSVAELGVHAQGATGGVWAGSTAGNGVYGRSSSAIGVHGHAGEEEFGGVVATKAGVLGTSEAGHGVFGGSEQGIGVWGYSHDNKAVYGLSQNDHGVEGHSGTTDSVYGSNNTAGNSGVLGEHTGSWAGVEGSCDNGSGVYGRTTVGSAVHGYASSTGRAGFFRGKVEIQGNLTKSSGSFRIDHPLDPENKYLSHSFVESPDMMNVYNGNVVTDAAGEAVVVLPDWFEALNRDFRYQLTPVGGAAPNLHVADRVSNGRFRIAGAMPGLEVSWQVTGIRQDRWAQEHPIAVEEDKPEGERGYYLHPELYGLDDTASTNAMTRAEAAMADRPAEAASQAEPR